VAVAPHHEALERGASLLRLLLLLLADAGHRCGRHGGRYGGGGGRQGERRGGGAAGVGKGMTRGGGE
jgi:hypothetical protein